ncbi:protein FAM83B isoform X2 [Salmo trutta]|uniref:Protein FAM83B-like n=2 Tax=Salmo trutta TaxID=8032 RepID=A0A674F6W0_SALTR|nr:protein FAM83B-like isoform X2 [Salmo trutta]XP_029595536.1 protein FAM83B-like isoform X2 [Salmo trutta]
MESKLSCLLSFKEDMIPAEYIQPHYKESYRLAIYALVSGGNDAYQEYLKAEQLSDFLSEEEVIFILDNAELPVPEDEDYEAGKRESVENVIAPSTYFPTESDEEVPDLDLGWPEFTNENVETNISLLFHPPRHNTPTIKEMIRKQIQDARQVIAIAMDVFTDVDILKEIVNATTRGVMVYILLDDFQFKSFLNMAKSAGVQIQDLKNLRVRTVKGQQYMCRSGAKFHGSLEQRFLLVDCKTVLYGTYSFMWSYEKINLSMVLVVTGQLVGSYDEEFRRLFARSTLPATLSQERDFRKEPATSTYDPYSGRLFESRLSLDQIHMRSRGRQLGLMSSTGQQKDDRYNNGQMVKRGLSFQDRLNQSHCTDMGKLVRGHSYAGELPRRGNSTTHLRNVRDEVGGAHGAPERGKRSEDLLFPGRMNHYTQKRYGIDQQHLLPYSSENSLSKWKIDSYLNNSDATLGEPVENLHLPDSTQNPNTSSRMRTSVLFNSRLAEQSETPNYMSEHSVTSPQGSLWMLSPQGSLRVTSPQSSLGGLSNFQAQLTPARLRESQTRLEEIRRKRLSLNEYEEPVSNLRPGQSQDSLRLSIFATLERAKGRLSERALDKRHSAAELAGSSEHSSNQGPSSCREELTPGGQQEEENRIEDQKYKLTNFSDAQRSVSQYDITTKTERNPLDDWQEPLSRTMSAAQLGIQLKEPLLKPSNFRPTGLNVESSKALTSLIGIPEEKEGPTRKSHGSTDQLANISDLVLSADKEETCQSVNPLKPRTSVKSIMNMVHANVSVEKMVEKTSHKEEGAELQRQNSFRSTIQRIGSVRSKHLVQADISAGQRTISDPPGKPSAVRLTTSPKGHSPSPSRSSHIAAGTETEKEQQQNSLSPAGKSSSPGLTTSWVRRSFRKKCEPDQDSLTSTNTVESEASIHSDTGRKRAYSRFESFVSFDNKPSDKPTTTTTNRYDSDKHRSLFVRHPSISSMHSYQTETTPNENKLGRFIQRVGNLISKK